jgi:hypothetical protein
VTGHGIDAAADMAMAKFVFRSLAREHPEPDDFLAAANEVVVGEIGATKFITLLYLTVDPETGELEAPLGTIANLGDAVLGLAAAFGGRSVATAEFATRDPRLPITLAAREGEPLILAAGDRRFVLP